MIEREEREDVTIVRLAHGKASALDLELCDAIAATFEDLARTEPRAVVLTGSGSIFCAGVDLKRVVDGGRAYLERFLPALDAAFRALFACPVPVVGAANGHAVAGGCILLCACDLRVMADGAGRIGVPELHVGVPFPPLALEILRASVGAEHLRRIVFTGETFPARDALALGLVDEVVEPEALLARALEHARSLGAVPPDTYALSKHQLRGPVIARVVAAAGDARAVAETWYAPEALEAIGAYVERVLAGRR